MLLSSIIALVFSLLQVAPSQSQQDTLSAAPVDTMTTVPQDTLSSAPQDTSLTAPRDSLSTTPRDTLSSGIQDTLSTAQQDSLSQSLQEQEAEEQIPDTVYVWDQKFPESFDMSETDSTLRWVNLLNLFDKFHKEKGAVTSRMGTVGRMDGILLHAYSTRHMNLEMEGLNYNDPLTGNVNWNRLPIHKIAGFYEADYGASYRSRIRLREHYLIQPRTYLNFDESDFDYRSLEFSYTQNFLKTTNLELSFWDRRDGGGYRSQAVRGQQVTARVYHQLNHRWLLKAGFINNGLDLGESFGYQLNDPALFSFNTFVASPVEPNASSEYGAKDLYVQIHHRADTVSSVSTKMGIHYQVDKRSLRYSADTLSTNFRRLEMFARHRVSISSAEVIGTGRLSLMSEQEKSNLTESSWLGGEMNVDASQKIGTLFELNGHGSFKTWNDGRSTSELSGRLIFRPIQGFRLSGFGGAISRAPDIQAAYWESDEFFGSSDLSNEDSQFIGLQAEIDFWRDLTFGVRGDIRNTTNAVFLQEGQFQNIDPYTLTSGTAWFSLDSRIFEGQISGTLKTYSSDSFNPVNSTLANSGERIWLKSHFYWKNYLFDRATFVKAGFSGVFSPNPFRTAEFIAPLNRWQHGTNEFINPSYYRVDVDVSARVRWFMILLKWENVLDQVQQLGYFESVGYPMPGRRFRFGVRVLFTN
ncbi:MAG: putative porin [Balneolaceae bacterium]|nr:putative porin [Balneolaceae bacterium]